MKQKILGWRTALLAYYEKHEERLSLVFFMAGFLFDVLTLSDIDDTFSIFQQLIYLLVMGCILCYDFLWGEDGQLQRGPGFIRRFWQYRRLLFHFLLGSLLSLYSLFFLMSASFFSSSIFVLILALVMIGNELPMIQKSGLDSKIALYVISVFCFFSLLVPVILGFVGRIPFFLSLMGTLAFLFGFYRFLKGKVGTIILKRRLLAPGISVALVFTIFYFVGWIPPVPLSAKKLDVYHRVEKEGDEYLLFTEKPWWKFWRSADQDFLAEPGEKIQLFVSVFSPARFEDQVFLRFYLKDPRSGWQTMDRIPMTVRGGRKGGYRGVITKQNYVPGYWRVSAETSDGREIGRRYFSVEMAPSALEKREFRMERY